MPIPVILGAMAASAAAKGVSALMNGDQDKKQYEQAEKLQNLNIAGADRMGDINEKHALSMFEKTGYAAQKAQMEQAGLSPSLMYGMGGAGGGTVNGGQATPVPTGQAADSSSRTQANTASTMALLSAANMQAQTRLTNAQADKIENIDTPKGQSENEGIKLDNKLKQGSLSNTLSILNSEANKRINEAAISLNDKGISDETYDARVAQIKQEATNSALEALAKESGIALNEAKIKEISQSIAQKWRELEIQGQNNNQQHEDRIKSIEEFTSNALKVAGIQAAGHIISDVVKIATRKIPTGGTKESTTELPDGSTINRYERSTTQY